MFVVSNQTILPTDKPEKYFHMVDLAFGGCFSALGCAATSTTSSTIEKQNLSATDLALWFFMVVTLQLHFSD